MVKKFFSAAIIYGLINGLGKSIQLLLIPILTRLFIPEDFGILDLTISIVNLLTIIGMVQLESALARFYYEKKYDSSKVFNTGLVSIAIISIFMSFLIVLSSGFISNTAEGKVSVISIISISFYLFFFNLHSYILVFYRFLKQPVYFALSSLSYLLLASLLPIIFVYFFHLGLDGYFIGIAFAAFISLTISIILLRHWISFSNLNIKTLRISLIYCLPLIPGLIASWSNRHISKLFIPQLFDLDTLGIYGTALKLAMIFKLFEEALKLVWLPYVYEHMNKKNANLRFNKIFVILTLTFFSICIILLIFNNEIVNILLPANYHETGNILPFLFISFCITLFIQILGIGTVISMKTIYNSIITILALTINLLIIFLTYKFIGIYALPIGFLSSTAFQVFSYWYLTERLTMFRFSKTEFFTLFVISIILGSVFVTFDISIITKIVISSITIVLFLIWIYIEIKQKPITKADLKFK